MNQVAILFLLLSIVCGISINKDHRSFDDVVIPNDDSYDVEHHTVDHCTQESTEDRSGEFDDDVFDDGKSNCISGFRIPKDIEERDVLVKDVEGCLTQFQDFSEEFGALVRFSNCIFDTTVKNNTEDPLGPPQPTHNEPSATPQQTNTSETNKVNQQGQQKTTLLQ